MPQPSWACARAATRRITIARSAILVTPSSYDAGMKRFRIDPKKRTALAAIDPADTSAFAGGKKKGLEKSHALQIRLGELQELLFAEHRQKVLIVLQGMDTSGKDGTVRHVMSECSPQ